jgi:hypothetical protein
VYSIDNVDEEGRAKQVGGLRNGGALGHFHFTFTLSVHCFRILSTLSHSLFLAMANSRPETQFYLALAFDFRRVLTLQLSNSNHLLSDFQHSTFWLS